ncbi:MAG: helix-turn-helix domain-containing protein [Candidatus Sumerlaeia bacterium]
MPEKDFQTEFLRIPWVARRLNISRKRVYQLIRDKQLAAVQFGPRLMRVHRNSLDEYINACRVEEDA